MNMRLACDNCGSQPCMCQEFECPFCDEHGMYAYSLGALPMQHKVPCSECGASGWVKCDGPKDGTCRWEGEGGCRCEAAWERQQEANASEPPMTADERHRQAWEERAALRAGLPS